MGALNTSAFLYFIFLIAFFVLLESRAICYAWHVLTRLSGGESDRVEVLQRVIPPNSSDRVKMHVPHLATRVLTMLCARSSKRQQANSTVETPTKDAERANRGWEDTSAVSKIGSSWLVCQHSIPMYTGVVRLPAFLPF